MLSQADKITSKQTSADNVPPQAQNKPASGLVLQDNRPQAVMQRQLHQAISNNPKQQQSATPGNVIQKIEDPLTESDIGKMYTIVVRGERVTARFKTIGRGGAHKFTIQEGREEGHTISVELESIIGETGVTGSARRKFEEKPKRKTPYERPAEPKRERAKPPVNKKLEESDEEGSGEEEIEMSAEERNRIDVQKAKKFLKSFDAEGDHSIKFRQQAQRLDMDSRHNSTLAAQMEARKARSKKKKKGGKLFIDPTYHETVQAIDTEYSGFAKKAEKELDANQTRIAYDMMLKEQTTSVEGSFLKASGPSPLTSLTPTLLSLYQDMHYKTVLKKGDDTSSTRAYESDYLEGVTKNIEPSHWRPFLLPADSTETETSVVNAFGGSLDVQTPTSGATIGSGKIYSAVFKHFQRSMELINTALDKDAGYIKQDPKSFKDRTIAHSKLLDEGIFHGLYANEEANFEKGNGFDGWPHLKRVIDLMVKEVTSAVNKVPDEMSKKFTTKFDINKVSGSVAEMAKQIELVGTILGLMVKKEKRLLLNARLFGSPKDMAMRLNNLYKISVFEKVVNQQIAGSEGRIGRILRQEQERRGMKKESDNLK